MVGLLFALAITGLSIVAVVDGLVPGVVFAILAVAGMAITILGDVHRREAVKQRELEEAGKRSVKGHAG